MAISTDIAKRVYDHTFKLDPIIRSLLDTDFYKLMMLQMIWGLYRDVNVTFSLLNRTTRVRIADEIDEGELRDAARLCAHAALHQEGDDLARRQQFLWPRPHLRPEIPRLARRLFAPRIRAAQGERPIRAPVRRALDPHHDVGNPGARDHQRAALARRAAQLRPLHPRRRLCAGEGQAVVEGRTAAPVAGPAHLRFRHPAAPRLSVAALVRRGAQGGARATS